MWTNAFFTSVNSLFSSENWVYRLPPALFNLSLTASIVILAVLVARLLLRKAPRAYSYALWAVVAFRLICPISFSSSFSLLGLINAPVAETGQVEYVPVDIVHTPFPSVDLIVPEINEAINEQLPYGAEQLGADPLEAPAALATGIWLIGVSVLLIWALSSYLSLRKKMRTAILLESNVYQSDQVGSPFILGLFRPKIYIPFGLDDSTLRYVLAHERYHLKRLDHVVKAFSFIILIIYWFNPLCWLAFHLMSKDMEMSCDEKVLSLNNNKTEYSTVLLSFASNHRFPSPCPLAFGETSAKSRIKNALKWKHPKVWVTILAVVLCIAVIAACAADPKEKNSSENEIKNPYDWTSTVEHGDIYGVSIQLLDSNEHTTIDLGSEEIEELITCLNNVTPADLYTGRGIPAQIKVVVTLTNGEDLILHYGTSYIEILYPGISSGDGIWMIRDTELKSLLSKWLVQLQQAPNNSEVFITTETPVNTAFCEINPLLSYTYPAFPFRFDFPYSHIDATCTAGTLFYHDPKTSQRTFGHNNSLRIASGQTLYWDPFSEQFKSSSVVISFTVYDGDTVLHSGDIQINQMQHESSSVGQYFYSASLTGCNSLILSQGNENHGGGWISEISFRHDLTEKGSVKLSASQLSGYRFKTNSKRIFIDFDRSDDPIEIQLYATDAEEPLLFFSSDNRKLSSCSFSNLTSAREYHFTAQCPPDTVFTIHD